MHFCWCWRIGLFTRSVLCFSWSDCRSLCHEDWYSYLNFFPILGGFLFQSPSLASLYHVSLFRLLILNMNFPGSLQILLTLFKVSAFPLMFKNLHTCIDIICLFFSKVQYPYFIQWKWYHFCLFCPRSLCNYWLSSSKNLEPWDFFGNVSVPSHWCTIFKSIKLTESHPNYMIHSLNFTLKVSIHWRSLRFLALQYSFYSLPNWLVFFLLLKLMDYYKH